MYTEGLKNRKTILKFRNYVLHHKYTEILAGLDKLRTIDTNYNN